MNISRDISPLAKPEEGWGLIMKGGEVVKNALEDFLPVRGPRQPRPWHAICRWVGASTASVHTVIWLQTMAHLTAGGILDLHDYFPERRRIVRYRITIRIGGDTRETPKAGSRRMAMH